MGTGGKMAAIFILSLFFSTAFIAFFDLGLNGSTRVQLIELPNTMNGNYHNTINAQTCNLTSYDISGSVSCGGSGVELNSGEILLPAPKGSNDGNYNVKYHITAHDAEYKIIVTETNYGNYIHINVQPNGISIPSVLAAGWAGRIETGTAFFAPVDGNIQDVWIETKYNVNKNSLEILYNGEYFFVHDTLPPHDLSPAEITNFGGVSSEGNVLIEGIDANFAYENPDKNGGLNFDNILGWLSGTINFGFAMLALATYTYPYDVIPFEIQLWIIAPQEFLIAVGIAIFIREG